MAFHLNKNFLEEEDLQQFYRYTNKIQKRCTEDKKNSAKIDLFVVLDISGSMSQTCNKVINRVNTAAGFMHKLIVQFLTGGIVTQGKVLISSADSRLTEAKKHLAIQIRDLIRQNRISKLGLITFNQTAQVAHPLTEDFQKIIDIIQRQQADGSTALYDSLKFAANQLKGSENPRILVMTDGQDNSSETRDFDWAREWFEKDGLKSTFFTICQGDNWQNKNLAQKLQAEYIKLGDKVGFRIDLTMNQWQEVQDISSVMNDSHQDYI